jgi:BirA family biotin operon repressor/biotin-[acetyl-CoA-carboxylase] ligase
VPVADRLLDRLAGGAWCSGEDLARTLGVSRAAIWKRIAHLRELGYAIEARRGQGYRLVAAADLLLPDEIRRSLSERLRAREIVHCEEIDSTNRLAADLARQGAAHGCLVVAERQTAGRGRLGRSWESPARLNFYGSVILRPSLPPSLAPQITLAAAIAVAEAVEGAIGTAPAVKWPNDVLLDGRKVAGILTELDAEADRIRFAILGIGVNLNATAGDFPAELRRTATSLRLFTGRAVDRARFAANLLECVDRRFEELVAAGFARLRPAYERFHCLSGRPVEVSGQTTVRGIARGVDDSGALLVDTDTGLEAIVAGEVTLRGSNPLASGSARA